MNNKEIESYRQMSKELWWDNMIERHGSKEKVRAIMRARRSLVKKPGLSNASDETKKRVSKSGVESRAKD